MKSTNIYSKPIEKKYVHRIITSESPSHRKHIWNGAEFDLTSAIDFMCNNETPIHAALDGEVFDVQDNVTKNYSKLKAPSEKIMPENQQDGNFVVLKHENEEYSIYSHLKKNSIKVKPKQKVKTGDIIALSGETGWSIEPHLHFMVFNLLGKTPDKGLKSLEVQWK